MSGMNPGCLGLIGAPTYPMLRDVTQVAFWEILELENIPFEFIKSEHKLFLPECGSSILFRSLDNPERLRGTNLAWFGVDELTFCKEAAWLRLEARLREPRAMKLEAFAVWTPNGWDWVYDKFVTGKQAAVTFATARENYHVASMYDRLEASYDPKFYRQEVLGEYLNIRQGAVYYSFSRAESMHAGLWYDENLPLIWSLDFNVNPMCSIIAQVHDYAPHPSFTTNDTKQLWILDEISLPDSNIPQACREFIRRAKELPRRTGYGGIEVHLHGDASGNARTHAGKSNWDVVVEQFQQEQLFRVTRCMPAANPHVDDRVNAVNGALLNAQGQRRIVIHPQCVELAKDLEQVVWKQTTSGGTTGEIDKSDPKRTHISDAAGYVIYKEFKSQKAGYY